MVEAQIISKILLDKSFSFLSLNNITSEYFGTYLEEYQFIQDHYDKYGSVPDAETFFESFTDFPFVKVSEPEAYLLDKLREEHLFEIAVPVINNVASLMKEDSRKACEFLLSQLPILTAGQPMIGTDIIANAADRYDEWQEKINNPDSFFISTGFKELDDILGGGYRRTGGELAIILARTGQGKSWIIVNSLKAAWSQGYRVGFIEPEMTANSIGYRFDTLYKNFSNRVLTRGEQDPNYYAYIDDLVQKDIPIFVATPRDFRKEITVPKLQSFVEANNLQVLGIDGIGYLSDTRSHKNTSRTDELMHVSEDLMELSQSHNLPIIVVSQANRTATASDSAPELDTIRGSDAISHNATVITSIKQKEPGLEMSVKKNRNGPINDSLTYLWDIDKGTFLYMPSQSRAEDSISLSSIRQQYSTGKEQF